MKTHTLELTEEQIDKYGLRELLPFTGWAKCDNNSAWLIYYEENKLKYGIDVYSEWFEIGDFNIYKPKEEHPATPEEIETGLIEMANKLGFKEGTIAKWAYASFSESSLKFKHLFYSNDSNMLTDGYGHCVFYNGKWAQIIPDTKEMTIEEIQKELGYKIKIVE